MWTGSERLPTSEDGQTSRAVKPYRSPKMVGHGILIPVLGPTSEDVRPQGEAKRGMGLPTHPEGAIPSLPTTDTNPAKRKRKGPAMALTETPLTMANAVHAFATLDTGRQVRILTSEGQSYATEDLVNRMRAAYPSEWASLVVAMLGTTWHDYAADLESAARHQLRGMVAA